MKICNKCNVQKPKTEFHKHKRYKDGYRTTCKECRKLEGKLYREKNRDRLLKEKKEWYKKSKKKAAERTLTQLKEGTRKCNQCSTVKDIREYRERANGGFYSICRECELLNNKQYADNNPEVIKRNKVITEQRRRARKAETSNTLTTKEWQETKLYFENTCAYCGRRYQRLSQDHFIPLSKGGGYDKDNIIPACRQCNSSKHNSLFEEWYPTYKHYSPERERIIQLFIRQYRAELIRNNKKV